MKTGFMRWFYMIVQFVMLAVSIPKVATLFHAYDDKTIGPLLGGIDLRSWLVGLAIDLTATFTTWAAMAKYEESRRLTARVAPGLIILVCSALSVVANYEDAATQQPAEYAHVSLFTQPALLVNPILISAPPVLVFLLILLVPAVLARPRLKTKEEIEAEVEEAEARIAAEARVKQAHAKANAQVIRTRIRSYADAITTAVSQPVEEENVVEGTVIPRDEPEPEEPEPPRRSTRSRRRTPRPLPVPLQVSVEADEVELPA